MSTPMLKRVAGAALVLSLGACASPYRSYSVFFADGYEDFELPSHPGTHYVSFTGNAFTRRSIAVRYWHRRAAEICGGGYDVAEVTAEDLKNLGVAQNPQTGQTTISQSDSPRVDGYIRCKD